MLEIRLCIARRKTQEKWKKRNVFPFENGNGKCFKSGNRRSHSKVCLLFFAGGLYKVTECVQEKELTAGEGG